MSDDLAVGGPECTSVVTTELVEESSRLAQLGWEMESCQRALFSIDRVIGNGMLSVTDAPISAIRAEQAIDEATAAMGQAHQLCERLRHALAAVAEHYEQTDNFVARLEQSLAAQLGYLLGTIAPVLVAVLLPGALVAAGGVTALLASLPEKTRADVLSAMGSWLKENSAFLTDPGVVAAVRLGVMSTDDFGVGLVGLPPAIASALGDEGLGILGVDTTAAVLIGVGASVGLLRETPVRVTAGATTKGVADVENMVDRLERIPSSPDQVRIERHSSPGQEDWFDVYIGGTEDFSPVSGESSWDLTSNFAALAGGSDGSRAASYRAVEQAMTLAGIDSNSPVEFNGYSQGGLIAAQLAASGNYHATALVTIAAPDGQVAVPHDIPYLKLAHSDDLVPALGGTHESSDPVVVSRRVFDSSPPPTEPVLPAHRLVRYLDTAALIDESTNLRLRETLQQLEHPRAETVTSTVYHAERGKQ